MRVSLARGGRATSCGLPVLVADRYDGLPGRQHPAGSAPQETCGMLGTCPKVQNGSAKAKLPGQSVPGQDATAVRAG